MCRNGHPWVEENLWVNSKGYNGCLLCRREADRARNKTPKRRAQDAAKYRRRAEAHKESNRAWVARNRDRYRNYQRDFQAKRRVQKRENGAYEVSAKDLRRLKASDCAHAHLGGCDGRMEVDHIVPVSRGGSHGIGNLQMLCRRHNASKFNSLEVEVKSRAQEDAAA